MAADLLIPSTPQLAAATSCPRLPVPLRVTRLPLAAPDRRLRYELPGLTARLLCSQVTGVSLPFVLAHPSLPAVAELVKADIPCSPGAGGVGSIPANSDAQNVPSFRRWRFEMKLSTFN